MANNRSFVIKYLPGKILQICTVKKVVPQSKCIEGVSVKRMLYSGKQCRSCLKIGLCKKQSAKKGEDDSNPVFNDDVHIREKQSVCKDEEK